MLNAPKVAQPLFDQFSPAFRQRTFVRMRWMVLGAILLRGRRTFIRILFVMKGLVQGGVFSLSYFST